MYDFTTLMSNALELGPYDDICHPTNTGQEMLIVKREGGVLRISDSQKIDPSGPDVVSNYRANNSMYGICAREESSGGGISGFQTTYFVLVREIPEEAPIDGTFFPADGVARVTYPPIFLFGNKHLMAAGRHDHSDGSGPGGKTSWRFTASELWRFPFEIAPDLVANFPPIDIHHDRLVDFDGRPFGQGADYK